MPALSDGRGGDRRLREWLFDVFPVGILPCDLAAPEFEQVAPADFDAFSRGRRPPQGPFGDATIPRYEMAVFLVSHVWYSLKSGENALPNS